MKGLFRVDEGISWCRYQEQYYGERLKREEKEVDFLLGLNITSVVSVDIKQILNLLFKRLLW